MKAVGRFSALLLLTALLTACGFHLRGSTALPDHLTPVYLDKESMTLELYRELRSLLKTGEGQVAEERGQAASVLSVLGERRTRKVLSVDSQGRAQEYELHYDLDFMLRADDETLIEQQRITLKRNLLFNPDTVLGVSQEADNIYQDMIRDSAGLVLLKLRAADNPAADQEGKP